MMRIAAILALAALPAAAQDPEETARTLRAIRDKVAPAVVAIEVARSEDPEGETGGGAAGTAEDYYNRPRECTSGTILSADGYILTCAFNVSGEILKITVITADGKRHEAKRLGTDARLDVTLLRIDAKGLPTLPRAKLEDARVGDFMCVIGRSPDPFAPTVNLGILSALQRRAGGAVQTDAEINYGNVGGPLVNLAGELVGVTVDIRPRAAHGQSGGVGFAAKLAEVDKVLAELKKGKDTAKPVKGLAIGILPGEPADGLEGVVVDQILPNSPAEEAGLDAGDVIVALDGRPVKTADALRAELAKKPAGTPVELTFRRLKRDGKTWETKKVKIKPVENQDQSQL